MVSRHCSVPGNPEAAVGNSQAVEHKDNSLASGEGAHYESIDSMLLSATQQPPSAKTVNRIRTNYIRPARYIKRVQLHRWLMAKIASVGLVLSSAALRRLPVLSLEYTAVSELCSWFQRTVELYSRGFALPASAGPLWEIQPSGHLQTNMRTQARIQHMQKQLSESPFLSQTELRLLMQGWDAGEEWYSRTHSKEIDSGSFA